MMFFLHGEQGGHQGSGAFTDLICRRLHILEWGVSMRMCGQAGRHVCRQLGLYSVYVCGFAYLRLYMIISNACRMGWSRFGGACRLDFVFKYRSMISLSWVR